ncbi:hypothetical protein CROQUDRAFT_540319 [Cronartium quercuum f. sp. fusiforme G11]|uniref:Uncharacterized protein n=1 Tax=Cronartium quercuum f. sp. fusiforme G11 TaxID=708437 RepID=A0A9P6TGE2_9BASI|nr:hypothetical protein CROQUDRAFT_540319 [Cronartium quercuum f. sp. fusiforme G11]
MMMFRPQSHNDHDLLSETQTSPFFTTPHEYTHRLPPSLQKLLNPVLQQPSSPYASSSSSASSPPQSFIPPQSHTTHTHRFREVHDQPDPLMNKMDDETSDPSERGDNDSDIRHTPSPIMSPLSLIRRNSDPSPTDSSNGSENVMINFSDTYDHHKISRLRPWKTLPPLKPIKPSIFTSLYLQRQVESVILSFLFFFFFFFFFFLVLVGSNSCTKRKFKE